MVGWVARAGRDAPTRSSIQQCESTCVQCPGRAWFVRVGLLRCCCLMAGAVGWWLCAKSQHNDIFSAYGVDRNNLLLMAEVELWNISIFSLKTKFCLHCFFSMHLF